MWSSQTRQFALAEMARIEVWPVERLIQGPLGLILVFVSFWGAKVDEDFEAMAKAHLLNYNLAAR